MWSFLELDIALPAQARQQVRTPFYRLIHGLLVARSGWTGPLVHAAQSRCKHVHDMRGEERCLLNQKMKTPLVNAGQFASRPGNDRRAPRHPLYQRDFT